MLSCQVFAFVLVALFKGGISQQETCQAQVVIISQAELRKEIANAFQTFTGVANASANASTCNTATHGLAEQVVARIEGKLDQMNAKLDSLEKRMNVLHELGSTPCHAASSCAEILENNRRSLSGHYWVTNSTGHPHSVYCDMTRSCGGVNGGWMRVAYLDMTNSSHQCPSGLRQRTDSGIRSCAAYSDGGPTCSSVLHRSHGIQYSRVCGKLLGYQARDAEGFNGRSASASIESAYLDGVSLTHGTVQKHHIWSFAGGPCTSEQPPAFVGNNYFFDGHPHRNTNPINLQNPLWDGEGCGTNTCCRLNNPPWFRNQLPQPTTDDIEMRVCRSYVRSDEDVVLKAIEIYVK